MLYGLNAACFGARARTHTHTYIYIHTESHHQAGKAPKKNSYLSHLIFPYIMQAYC